VWRRAPAHLTTLWLQAVRDLTVAEAWGRIVVRRSVPVIDALLAATALVHGHALVTRNTADVSGLGIATLNPFEGAAGRT
jgi:predicted nucleic acid-binding protein